MSRGRAAIPKTALPSPIESKIPTAAPINPPTKPSSAASVKNSRCTRRVAPPMAFISPTSLRRSIATLVIAAKTHSAVRIRTSTTVAVKQPADLVVDFPLRFTELADRTHIQ